MEHDLNMTVFWVIHLIMLGLFGVELIFVLSVWLKATVPGVPADASRWRKLGAALARLFRLVFSQRIFALLRALVVDGMVHHRLYKRDLGRWAVHIAVFGSWLLLGVISTVTGVIVEILPLLGMEPDAVASIPLLGGLFHPDVWWVALLNDILGLIVMAGMILIIYRRYVAKDPQLRTIPADTITIAFLAIIAFSGFPTEASRLLADYTTATGGFHPDPAMLALEQFPPALYSAWGPQWGFVGYASAAALGALGLGAGVWQALYLFFFWFHFVIVTALLYYLPFSRFFHVIMSPVIVAYNTVMAEEARDHRKLRERQVPQALG
jgi:hypothetical protein